MKIRHTALYCDLYDDIDAWLSSIGSNKIALDLIQVKSGGSLDENPLLADLTPQEFAASQLLETFLKKFQDCPLPSADQAALESFLTSDNRCKEWELPQDRSTYDDLLLGLFKQELYRFFYRGPAAHILSSLSIIERYATTGPGASVGAQGTDFYTKMFSGPLTGTRESLYRLYEHSYAKSTWWSRAENQRREHFGGFERVRGSRLSFVPKNVNTSRCICTEPVLNMFYQQGVKGILEARLRQYFGIDLSDQQECNQELARIGSIDQSFCTIDLSSASDSVALSMIKEMFPRDVVSWLLLFRSPEVQLPNGTWKELSMISSMGNAYTFPLETIIFSCVVSACYDAEDIPLIRGYSSHCEWNEESRVYVQTRHLPNFGVFGDDIIVLKKVYNRVVRLLNMLGFRVNTEKSFCQGPFRESCGGDYFRGYPCRGVYIKTLRSQASRYVAINRLNEWSAFHEIPLRKTIKRLMKGSRYLPVPLYENDDAGVKVPLDLVQNLKLDPNTQSILYRKWESIPQKIAIQDGALKLPKGSRLRIYNSDGLLLAALRGDVRNESIGSRLGPARYRSKEAISPNWDWLPPVAGGKTPVGQLRLAAAIRTNLA